MRFGSAVIDVFLLPSAGGSVVALLLLQLASVGVWHHPWSLVFVEEDGAPPGTHSFMPRGSVTHRVCVYVVQSWLAPRSARLALLFYARYVAHFLLSGR